MQIMRVAGLMPALLKPHAGIGWTGRTRCGPVSPGIRLQARRPTTTCGLSLSAVNIIMCSETVYTAGILGMMALRPHWKHTKQVVFSNAVFAPIALGYLVLLLYSWSPDFIELLLPGSFAAGLQGGCINPQFFPKLEGIMTLFSRTITAASLWVHLLATNLFAARAAYQTGLKDGVPFRHSVLLCAAFGPLGLCSHFLTEAITKARVVQTAKGGANVDQASAA